MGSKTGIEWTDKTWNPWVGCAKVSAGCKNCYMFRDQRRLGLDPTVVRRSKTTFDDPLNWKDEAMVFTCSWSDFFIKEADLWRSEAWGIIRATPNLTYQILTKRPERIEQCLPPDWPYPNVWLGASAEDQKSFDERIAYLSMIQAAVRFISAEPLLGEIDFTPYLGTVIQWVIVGGESGPNEDPSLARPMSSEWVRSIFLQCKEMGVPMFFKQWGEWIPVDQEHPRFEYAKKFKRFDDELFGYLGRNVTGHAIDSMIVREFP